MDLLIKVQGIFSRKTEKFLLEDQNIVSYKKDLLTEDERIFLWRIRKFLIEHLFTEDQRIFPLKIRGFFSEKIKKSPHRRPEDLCIEDQIIFSYSIFSQKISWKIGGNFQRRSEDRLQ